MAERVIPDLQDRLYTRTDICIAGCTNESDQYMIRCILCSKWYHRKCLQLATNEFKSPWVCVSCRHIADEVADIRATVIQLVDIVTQTKAQIDTFVTLQTTTSGFLNDIKDTTNTIKDTTDTISTGVTLLTESSDAQQTQVNEIVVSQANSSQVLTEIKEEIDKIEMLQTNLDSLSERIVSERDDSDSEGDSDSESDLDPEGHLIIADSLARDLLPTEEGLNSNVEVRYISGGKYANMTKKLRSLQDKYYSDITVIGGTNNCSTKQPEDKILGEFQSLLDVAKEKADNVHISGIPPRVDKKTYNTKISSLNEKIRDVVSTEECVDYIDQDKNFKYQDGSIDESLLQADGLHLSDAGVKRLIDNIGLRGQVISKLDHSHTDSHTKIPASGRRETNQPGQNRSTQAKSSTTDSERKQQKPFKPWPGIKNLPHKKKKRLFKGGGDPLSNFRHFTFRAYGLVFKSLEHAYQWRKAMYMGREDIARRILNAPTAADAKRIADNELNTMGTNWFFVKRDFMNDLLIAKCEQCPEFLTALLESGDEELIEDTNHEYWARGREGNGMNMLGMLLMEIRDVLYSRNPQNTNYRPPANNYHAPCFKCGEGNHNSATCWYPEPIKCESCPFVGHKHKHCPERC